MRESWKFYQLGVLGNLTSSKRIFKKEYVKDGVPFFRSKEIKELAHDKEISVELFITKERYQQIKSKFGVPKEGDILLTAVGTIGEMYIVKENEEFYFKDGNIMWLKDFKDVNSHYLKYVLTLLIDQIKALSRGSAYNALTIEKLSKYSIPVPPISEQKRIVTVLNQAFVAIDQAKENIEINIENAKELFQSKLNEIFSQKEEDWEEKRLIDIATFIDYRGRTPSKTDRGIRLITAKNVRMGYLKSEPEEFIAEENYKSWMTRGIPKKMDVLFTTEAPLANVAILNTSEKIALAQRIITLSPELKYLDGEYLSYCLQSKVVQDKILEKGTGATVTGIKSKLLKEITIPVAPKEKQPQMVATLNLLRQQVILLDKKYQLKASAMEEFRKSILQKAFSGELTQKEIEV